jgi:hypothetical protein
VVAASHGDGAILLAADKKKWMPLFNFSTTVFPVFLSSGFEVELGSNKMSRVSI